MRPRVSRLRPLRPELQLRSHGMSIRFERFAISDRASVAVELALLDPAPAQLDLRGSLDDLRGARTALRSLDVELEADRLAAHVQERVTAADARIEEVHLALGSDAVEATLVVREPGAKRDVHTLRVAPAPERGLPLRLRLVPPLSDEALEGSDAAPWVAPALLALGLTSQRDEAGRWFAPLGDPRDWIRERLTEAGWAEPDLSPLAPSVFDCSEGRIRVTWTADSAPTIDEPAPTSDGHLRLAARLRDALRSDATEDHVQAALAVFPRSGALWSRVAELAQRSGDAEAHLHALKRQVTLAATPQQQADALLAQAELEYALDPGSSRARNLLERARQRMSSDPNALTRLARLYRETGQNQAAARTWSRAADAWASADAHDASHHIARCHLEAARLWHDVLHDADNAILALRRCLTADATEPEAVRRCWSLHSAREDHARGFRQVQQAVETAERALALEPDAPALRTRMATLYHVAADAHEQRRDAPAAERFRALGERIFAGDGATLPPVDRRRTDRRATAAEASPSAGDADALRRAIDGCRRRARNAPPTRDAWRELAELHESLAVHVHDDEQADALAEAAVIRYYELDEPATARPLLDRLYSEFRPRVLRRPELAGALQELLEGEGATGPLLDLLEARGEAADDPRERTDWQMLAARCALDLGDPARAVERLLSIPADQRDIDAWPLLRARSLAATSPEKAIELLHEVAPSASEHGAMEQLQLAVRLAHEHGLPMERSVREALDARNGSDVGNLAWLADDALQRTESARAREFVLRVLGVRLGGFETPRGVDDVQSLLTGWDSDELLWEAERLAPHMVRLAHAAWQAHDPAEAARWIDVLVGPLGSPPEALNRVAELAHAHGDATTRRRAVLAVTEQMLPGPARDTLLRSLDPDVVRPAGGAPAPPDGPDLPDWDEGVTAANARRLAAIDAEGARDPRRAVDEVERLLPRARNPRVRRALLVRRGRWLRIAGDLDDATLSLKGALILQQDAPDTRWELALMGRERTGGDRVRALQDLWESVAKNGRPTAMTRTDARRLMASLAAAERDTVRENMTPTLREWLDAP